MPWKFSPTSCRYVEDGLSLKLHICTYICLFTSLQHSKFEKAFIENERAVILREMEEVDKNVEVGSPFTSQAYLLGSCVRPPSWDRLLGFILGSNHSRTSYVCWLLFFDLWSIEFNPIVTSNPSIARTFVSISSLITTHHELLSAPPEPLITMNCAR